MNGTPFVKLLHVMAKVKFPITIILAISFAFSFTQQGVAQRLKNPSYKKTKNQLEQKKRKSTLKRKKKVKADRARFFKRKRLQQRRKAAMFRRKKRAAIREKEEDSPLDVYYSGDINSQLRYFPDPVEVLNPEDGTVSQLPSTAPSFAFSPNFTIAWEDVFEIKGDMFYRYDVHDEDRTHFDARELYLFIPWETVELSVGAKQVFWGVVESFNIVDFVNQRDYIEDPFGQEKLGQPMVHGKLFLGDLSLTAIYMPIFRPIDFPSSQSYFSPPVPVEEDEATYELDSTTNDFALRINYPIWLIDASLVYFNGIHRTPDIRSVDVDDQPTLSPYYYQTEYYGGYGEIAWGDLLFKYEGLQIESTERSGPNSVYGVEYNTSFSGVSNLSLAVEYLEYVTLEDTISPFNNSVFMGSSLSLEDAGDSKISLSGIYNVDSENLGVFIDISRRFFDDFRLTLSGVKVEINELPDNAVYARDSFLQLDVDWYF